MTVAALPRAQNAKLLKGYAWALTLGALLCLPLSWVHHELGALRSWQLLLSPLLFLALASRGFEPLEAPGPSRRLIATSWAVALIWILMAQWLKYFAFAVNGIDFSIFDWMLHNTLRGQFMYSPIYEVNHFGVHPTYWMLLLVPLHALWPSPLMLTTVTALVVWAGCLPLWKLVKGRTENGWLAWLACAAYLTCAWTGRILDGGFRPEVLYPLAGFTLLLTWERQRWVFAAALLLLSVKEDAALYLAGFSLAVLVSQRQRWRAALGLLLLSAVVFGLNVGVVQPAALAASGVERPRYMSAFWSDYGATMSEVVRFILTHPLRVAGDVLGSSWLKLFAPLLLLPLLSPRMLGMMLPGIVLLGSATYPLMRDFGSYYAIPLLAPALWGTVEVCTSPRAARHAGLARALLTTALLAFPLFWVGYLKMPRPQLELRREVIALAPELAVAERPGPLCAQTAFFPYLAYALEPTPLLWPSCLEQPGAWGLLHLTLNPTPFERGDLEAWVERAREQGKARQFPEGTWLIEGPNPK